LKAWAKAPVVGDELSSAAFARLLYRHGSDGIKTRLKLALATARGKAEGDMQEMARSARLGKLLDLAENWKKPQFPINGTDVMDTGIAAGKQVGETLSALENLWIEENFTPDRAALLARLTDLTK